MGNTYRKKNALFLPWTLLGDGWELQVSLAELRLLEPHVAPDAVSVAQQLLEPEAPAFVWFVSLQRNGISFVSSRIEVNGRNQMMETFLDSLSFCLGGPPGRQIRFSFWRRDE